MAMVERPSGERNKGNGAGFLTALAVLFSPLLPLALAWLLVWITNAFGGTPESIGLQQLFGLLALLGTLGWIVTVPLAIFIALAALVRAVKRPKDGTS
jgi:hypothetical protein